MAKAYIKLDGILVPLSGERVVPPIEERLYQGLTNVMCPPEREEEE